MLRLEALYYHQDEADLGPKVVIPLLIYNSQSRSDTASASRICLREGMLLSCVDAKESRGLRKVGKR